MPYKADHALSLLACLLPPSLRRRGAVTYGFPGLGQLSVGTIERWLAPNRWIWPLVVGASLYAIPLSSDPFSPLRRAISDSLYQITASGLSFVGLGLSHIDLNNRTAISDELITKMMGLRDVDSILLINGDDVRLRLERNPRIASVSVQKLLPSTLKVDIEERRPFALWQRDGQYNMIDRQGAVIADEHLSSDGPLLQVVGKGANKQVAALRDLLEAFPVVRQRVTLANYMTERRWDILWDGLILVQLPATNVDRALTRLSSLLETLSEQALYPSRIDLRLPDRITLTPASGILTEQEVYDESPA